ncbi:MAG: glutamine synthetase GlnII [Ilumatobacter fluminis]|uniref:Glutamine synthetase n=1 Tax=Ilumatobacter fluminis TaxID=467091 RepID=A0A4R7HVS6_9ACTN|nr:glutamine synthetase GlnII [Ilumatobacter fluminis]TDT15082.1 L-glutamine synthetase [Ilumatobacter fluminis]
MAYQAEYIWLDGYEPTPSLRSKTKILHDEVTEPPIWGFDGSSTEQATGDKSDCVLKPVFKCPDPIRGGRNILVMCEVMLVSGRPHPTNTRNACAKVEKKFADTQMLFGLEQEYTMLRADRTPLGFPEGGGLPAPQGPYYCGVGTGKISGRQIVEEHTQACIDAGLSISGTNPEVMPGQWEFQVGPLGPTAVGDQLNVARWLLHRIAEDYDVIISFDAKPEKGDWNGAGCHTNFSNVAMRESYDAIIDACEKIGANFMELVENYGDGVAERLTGSHETAPWDQFSYGVSDRGASIRIPWQVEKDGKGYAEDRRPNANMDPYTVSRLITETINTPKAKPAKKKAAAKKK